MVKRRRKNFFITMVLIILFWSALAFLIFFVEPELVKNIIVPDFYLPFFVLFFLSLFFTLAVIFANSRRGLFISSALTLFLILRLYGLGNLLNAILITAFTISLDYYFTRED